MKTVTWCEKTAYQITYKISGRMGAWDLHIKNHLTGEWDHEVGCKTVADCNYHKACLIRRCHGMDGYYDRDSAAKYRNYSI